MQDKYLFEYAVIRYVPKVEREEFINVGVILFCNELKFLGIRYELNTQKILALAPDTDLPELKSSLLSFARICAGFGINVRPRLCGLSWLSRRPLALLVALALLGVTASAGFSRS